MNSILDKTKPLTLPDDLDPEGAALYDGDELLYRVTVACQQESHFNNEIQLTTDFDAVVKALKAEIEQAVRILGVTELHFALNGDGDANFRKSVYPQYKGNRKKHSKPLGYYRAEEWLVAEHPCIRQYDLEGDDILGLFGDLYAVGVSSDKDMKTVPGEWYSPYHKTRFSITEEQADFHWMFQTAAGDTTDGYPGAKGVGKVKATAMIEEAARQVGGVPKDKLKNVWRMVCSYFPSMPHALQQARCARILRPGEYTDRPLLWDPESLTASSL